MLVEENSKHWRKTARAKAQEGAIQEQKQDQTSETVCEGAKKNIKDFKKTEVGDQSSDSDFRQCDGGQVSSSW